MVGSDRHRFAAYENVGDYDPAKQNVLFHSLSYLHSNKNTVRELVFDRRHTSRAEQGPIKKKGSLEDKRIYVTVQIAISLAALQGK